MVVVVCFLHQDERGCCSRSAQGRASIKERRRPKKQTMPRRYRSTWPPSLSWFFCAISSDTARLPLHGTDGCWSCGVFRAVKIAPCRDSTPPSPRLGESTFFHETSFPIKWAAPSRARFRDGLAPTFSSAVPATRTGIADHQDVLRPPNVSFAELRARATHSETGEEGRGAR